MLSFLRKYAQDFVFSQNGEEGLILECLLRLGITSGHCVEIGAHDGRYCSNTALLLQGEVGIAPGPWTGLMVEKDFDLFQKCRANWAAFPGVKVTCSGASAENINAFVPEACDVFSTDTDGSDYQIFKALQAKPKIAIVEIDSGIPPGERGFNRDGAPGFTPMLELGIEKGYFLLAHCGNMFFVAEEYRSRFPEIKGDPLKVPELYFNPAWLQA